MAHFALLWKARTIEKCRINYEKEKLNSVRLTNSQIEKQSLFQRWKDHDFKIRKRVSTQFSKLYPQGSTVHNIFIYMKTDQTFPNFVLKSVIGFVGGIVLTYLCFMFFVFQLSISLMHATIMSSIIGVLLTLGLAFSYRIRCLVFLLIPQFFSRVGRYTLTCYALVLILTGPATNTLKNSEVLSESMACAQEQIKTNVHKMNELSENPMNAMKDTMKSIVGSVGHVADKLKGTLLAINRLVLSIVSRTFNKKLGTPYDRCIKVLNDAVLDCQASFGPRFSKLCNVNYAADVACGAVKHLKEFCTTVELVNESIVGSVKRKLKAFNSRMKAFLYVQVHVHHSYSFSGNSSRSASQVAAGIITEIRKRADPLLTWLSWSSCVTSLFLLLIIFRAKYYQHMFETRSRFDNRYVTKELRDLDLKRLRQGRETVLPLNRREKAKYIKTTSFSLVSSEKVHLSRSAVFMMITTFKLMIHMVADYSLYWVLMTIRHHGRFQSPLQPESQNAGAYIPDTGPVARIIRSILWSMSLPLAPSEPSPVYCLPNPYPPDLQRYSQIGILIFLLWFFALFEPYGLRLRHVIMGLYRPERAKARAVWLYNHIQRTRGGFMKFARRKLHREYKYSTEAKYTFKRLLDSYLPFTFLRYLLGTHPGEPKCLLCGTMEYSNDPDTQIVTCEIVNCPGTYCISCFSDIGNLCTICLSPIDYGDLSDISLEKGSSAESSDSENDFGSDTNDGKIEPSSLETDDSDNSTYKREPHHKPKWNIFSRKKYVKETQKEIPLLHTTKGLVKEISNTNKERIWKKALMKRHNRYCTPDINNNLCQSSQNNGSKHNLPPVFCQYCQSHNKICDRSVGRSSSVKDAKTNAKINIAKLNEPNNKTLSLKLVKAAKNSAIDRVLHHSKYFVKLRVYSIRKKSKTIERKNEVKNKLSKKNILSQYCKAILKKRRKRTLIKFKRSRTGFKLNWSRSKTKKIMLSYLPGIEHPDEFSRKDKIFRHIKKKRQLEKNATRLITFKNHSRIKLHNKLNYFVKSHGNKDSARNPKKKPKNVNMVVCCENNPKAKPVKIKVEAEESENSGSSGQDDETPGYSYSSKTFRYYTGKVRDLFTNHLPKFGFTPNAKFLMNYFRKHDIQLRHEKINHKRRKKISEEESSTSELKLHKANKKENDDTRKYRLSTYLSEQDWIKKRFNKKISSIDPIRYKIEISDESKEEIIPKIKNTKREDIEARISKILMKWKRDSHLDLKKHSRPKEERDCKKSYWKIKKDVNSYQSSTSKNLSLEPEQSSSTATYMGGVINILNISEKDEDQYQNLDKETLMDETYTSTTSFDGRISRTLNFYRSLGHDDFEPSKEPEIDGVDQFIDDLYKGSKDNLDKGISHIRRASIQNLNKKDHRELENIPSSSKLNPERSKVKGFGIEISDIIEDSQQKTKEANENTLNLEDTGELSNSGCPLSIFKYLLCGKFVKSKKGNKEKQEEIELKPQVDQEANVFPVVQSCACQHLSENRPFPTQDCTTQYLSTRDVSLSISQHVEDAEVDAEARTCTCAAQCISLCKDACTYCNCKRRTNCRDASTIHYNALRVKSCRDVATLHYNCFKRVHHSSIQCSRNIKDVHTQSHRSKSATVTYAPSTKDKPQERNKRSTHATRLRKEIVSSVETLHSRSSCKSDEETKTDTTICSLATIDYLDDTPRRGKNNRLKVSVITKTNQSTATDRKNYCDVSTVTHDWWSPIVERKEKRISLVKKKASYMMTERPKEMNMRKHRGILTDGKVVKFRSRAQIIPAGVDDILSPSRYLLESQKYYNELFTPKFYAPHFISAMASVQTPQHLDKGHSPIHCRKGYKPKRLEDGYSPRKMTSQKKFEYKWTDETGNQMRSPVFKNQHRTGTKLKGSKKIRKSHKQSHDKGNPSLMKAEKILLKRGFTSNNDLSQTCHCPSVDTTGSH